jgi:hypothetical protein
MKATLRKAFLFLQISIFLCNRTIPDFLDQINKLPVLIAHFHHHQTERTGLGFIEFISMHYQDDEATDDHDHHDLPWYQTCMCQHVMLSLHFLLLDDHAHDHLNKLELQPYKNLYQHTLASGIFQPPRV